MTKFGFASPPFFASLSPSMVPLDSIRPSGDEKGLDLPCHKLEPFSSYNPIFQIPSWEKKFAEYENKIPKKLKALNLRRFWIQVKFYIFNALLLIYKRHTNIEEKKKGRTTKQRKRTLVDLVSERL